MFSSSRLLFLFKLRSCDLCNLTSNGFLKETRAPRCTADGTGGEHVPSHGYDFRNDTQKVDQNDPVEISSCKFQTKEITDGEILPPPPVNGIPDCMHTVREAVFDGSPNFSNDLQMVPPNAISDFASSLWLLEICESERFSHKDGWQTENITQYTSSTTKYCSCIFSDQGGYTDGAYEWDPWNVIFLSFPHLGFIACGYEETSMTVSEKQVFKSGNGQTVLLLEMRLRRR